MDFLDPADLPRRCAHWLHETGQQQTALPNFGCPSLVVVDMQNDFLYPDGLLKVWGGPAIIPNVHKLATAFRTAGYPVFYSRHIYDDPEIDGGVTARWWKADRGSELLREGTWHAEIHSALKPFEKDRIITKRRYSAFFGTDLEMLLRTYGITDVVIAGVCTNICCEATAHDALFRDFNVFMVIDATGATDESAHIGTFKNFALAYGRTVTTDQVIKTIQRREALQKEGTENGERND